MTMNQVMNYGTDGMTEAQKKTEMERRLDVMSKLNKIYVDLKSSDTKRKRRAESKLRQIKSEETVWLKEAAWFLYL